MSEEIGSLLELVTTGEWGNNQGSPGGIDTGVIRSANITKDHRFNTKEIAIRSIEERKRQKKMLRHGDILIEKSGGSPDQPVGRVLFYDLKGEHTCSNFISILRPSQQVDAKFLYYSLCNLYERGVVKNYQQQTTGIINLQLGEYLRESIYFPPLPEQKKIAEILSGVDNQIAKQQSKKCKYLHLLSGIIDRLMTHGTRGRKTIETDAGCIQENWKVGRVDDFFVLGRGRVISIPFIKEHPGPYPVFSSQSKNNGEMGRMDTFDFDGDYFTWTTDGAYAGSVFARSGKFNCTNVCGTGKAKSPEESDSKFAAYFLQRVAKGHVSYVGNPKLMNNAFADIPFALPPLDEQEEINAIIDSVKKNVELLEEQIVSLLNLKRSVASDLLSGRKRVTV